MSYYNSVKYLLRAHYALGSILGAGHTTMNKTDQEFGWITFIPISTSEAINYILHQMGICPISSLVIITFQVTDR